ncbi:hypothetical protein MKX01_001541 [Papaver californicum]|nr:hypothetical protein MKX01_001541 [Papaver californicum]
MGSRPGLSHSKMKLKVVCCKAYNYVRYDLKQMAFPSSLPDPPHIKKRRKLTWKERYYVLKQASRLYATSWVRDIGPDLRPNDYKRMMTVAARGGMETLRPALQRVYMTRASSYRDALKSFIQGYQEGVQQVMSGKDDPKFQQLEDPPKRSD